MSDHVLDEMLDFLAGRVGPERSAGIESHLSGCDECAQRFRWAAQLRDDAMGADLAHLPAARIVRIAEDPRVQPGPVEQIHLESCEECRGEIEWNRSLPKESDVVVDNGAGGSERSSSGMRWWIPLGLAAAVVVVVVAVMLPSREPADFASLARIEPLPVEITRDVDTDDDFTKYRVRGLEAYQAGDYAAARASFIGAIQVKADGTVSLYMASCELFLGMPAEAIERLRLLSRESEDPSLREEALWQLANAALAHGSIREAEQVLQDLIALDDYHGKEAADLLDAVRSAR